MIRGVLVLAVLWGAGCQPRIDVALWNVDPCAFDQKVCTTLEASDDASPACGSTRVIHGEVVMERPEVWTVSDCGGCTPCDRAHTIAFHGPKDWGPDFTPTCARIELGWTRADASPSCAWTATTIWADDETPDPGAPIYVARSLVALDTVPIAGWDVVPILVEEKPCKAAGCCPAIPGKYTFEFGGAAWTETVTVDEGKDVRDVVVDAATYDLKNVQSHVHEACDEIPHLDWLARRPAPGSPMDEPEGPSSGEPPEMMESPGP